MLLCRHNYRHRLVREAARGHLRAGASPDPNGGGMTRCWLGTSQTTSCCPSKVLPGVAPPTPAFGCGDPAEGDGSNRRLVALGSLQPSEESSCCHDTERFAATPASGPAKTPGGCWRAPGISRGPRHGRVVPWVRAEPHTWVLSSNSVGQHGGKQAPSPEMSHDSGARPHPRGDTSSMVCLGPPWATKGPQGRCGAG